MFDAHLHVAPPNLPGVGSLSPGLRAHPDNIARVLREQMIASGVTRAAAMGSWDAIPEDPLGVAKTLQVADRLPGLYAIGVADHRKTDLEHLRRVDNQLQDRRIVALKAYLGYVHAYPNDPGYLPYYELARKHRIPFFFHTGDPYSPYAKLKYAMPVHVDEVAVDFPEVNFVLAHVGNPWMVEAAEVVYKNLNVWTDLSGLLIGSEEKINSEEGIAARQDVVQRVRAAWRYAERPNRFLYGSDWPLAPLKTYVDFVREAIPLDYHEQVFEGNARVLFGSRVEG